MGLMGLMGLMGVLRRLKPPEPDEAFLTTGECYLAAVEGEGVPSDEQTEDPKGQSGRDGVDADNFGLEIDGSAVDATVAVGRGSEGGATLVSGEGGVLDIEELSADL